MNLVETLRGLLRRWYITFPGLVLAAAAAIGAWLVVPVEYERTATQFLLPGAASMPENSNPFLYLGGLSYATDVVVRALGSENVLNGITEDHPGVVVTVERDGSTSGPVVLTTVTAADDALAGVVLNELVNKTEGVLSDLQDVEAIPADNRISAVTLTVDDRGEVQQRNRVVATAGAGIAIAAATLVLAGLVDGVTRQRRRRAEDNDSAEDGEGQAEPGRDEDLPIMTGEIPVDREGARQRPRSAVSSPAETEAPEAVAKPAHGPHNGVRRAAGTHATRQD